MPGTDSIRAVVSKYVDQLLPDYDLFLVDLTVRGHQGSRVFEVFLDSSGVVSVDILARFSRRLESFLDEEIQGAYRLEVSSPGADRPLTHRLQFPKHVGRVLTVRHRSVESEEDVLSSTGELIAADDSTIVLRTKTDTISVTHDNLIDGVVQLPW